MFVSYSDDLSDRFRGIIVGILPRATFNVVVQWDDMPIGETVEYNFEDLRFI